MSLKRGFWIDHQPMVIDMNDAKLVTLEQVRGFLAGAADLTLKPAADPAARYGVIKQVLKRFKYPLLGRADLGLIRRYLQRVTGYSRPPLADDGPRQPHHVIIGTGLSLERCRIDDGREVAPREQ